MTTGCGLLLAKAGGHELAVASSQPRPLVLKQPLPLFGVRKKERSVVGRIQSLQSRVPPLWRAQKPRGIRSITHPKPLESFPFFSMVTTFAFSFNTL